MNMNKFLGYLFLALPFIVILSFLTYVNYKMMVVLLICSGSFIISLAFIDFCRKTSNKYFEKDKENSK